LFEGRYCEEYRSNDCFLMMHRKRNEKLAI
jgi:hypothetical protein